MPWWSYVLLVALAAIAAYLIWSFFRQDPTETAEVPEFPEEVQTPEDVLTRIPRSDPADY
jgi:hypothetical protein